MSPCQYQQEDAHATVYLFDSRNIYSTNKFVVTVKISFP